MLDPKWADQVLIRDPVASGTMRTIFGMVIQRSIRETGFAVLTDHPVSPELIAECLSRVGS